MRFNRDIRVKVSIVRWTLVYTSSLLSRQISTYRARCRHWPSTNSKRLNPRRALSVANPRRRIRANIIHIQTYFCTRKWRRIKVKPSTKTISTLPISEARKVTRMPSAGRIHWYKRMPRIRSSQHITLWLKSISLHQWNHRNPHLKHRMMLLRFALLSKIGSGIKVTPMNNSWTKRIWRQVRD